MGSLFTSSGRAPALFEFDLDSNPTPTHQIGIYSRMGVYLKFANDVRFLTRLLGLGNHKFKFTLCTNSTSTYRVAFKVLLVEGWIKTAHHQLFAIFYLPGLGHLVLLFPNSSPGLHMLLAQDLPLDEQARHNGKSRKSGI
jgi:hypothetical protein